VIKTKWGRILLHFNYLKERMINIDNNKTFIRIPHNFFEINEEVKITLFHQIGTEGFTIWCYMLMRQGNQTSTEINIKRIKTFLNRDTRSKFKAKKGLNDARTIKKYIVALIRMQLIKINDDVFEEFDNVSDEEKNKIISNFMEGLRADDELLITVDNRIGEKDGFSCISVQLFEDWVHKIGHIGWSVYCMLFKSHNTTFGNQSAGNFGFANPSRLYIALILNRSERTIADYINNEIHMPCQLVKVIQQPCVTFYNAVSGNMEQKQEANHYIVNAKIDSGNKYYIDVTKKSKAS
jgi:hypothetical protein